MDNLANSIQNNALAALAQRAPKAVVGAIHQASAKTGVNFAYMIQQANAESSFRPDIKAKTSSATGLYQFIESTWMNMVEKHGHKYGIETESKSRKDLLELRKDPQIASFMAAELASDNKRVLDAHWGGEAGSTELYLAHFLGAGGAASFLKSKDENPLQDAALLFPKAAQANRNVFYDSKTGQGKTLAEVYDFFDKKFNIKTAELPQIVESGPERATTKEPPMANAGSSNKIYSNIFSNNQNIQALGGFKRSYSPWPYQKLVSMPIELMLLAQMELPISNHKSKNL